MTRNFRLQITIQATLMLALLVTIKIPLI